MGKSLILIVDDSPQGREILGSLLTIPDYELVYAADGPEAIALAEQRAPDLVLLDVMMPGMNGFEVCRRLRQHGRLSEVPIILVTALDDRESRLEGLDAGADDFVSKPIDRAELRVRVRTVTKLNRYRRLLNERLRFEWVVDQANDGYLIVGTGGKLMYANQSARLLLELPQATAEWREPLWMLVQRQFRCEPEKIWQHWFANEAEPPTHSIYLIRPETETAPALWLEVTVLAQEDRSGLEQLLHVRDVTAQLSTQRDTWSFHAMIMHKLNTPLQTLLGGLELLVPDSINEMSRTEISLMARLAQAGALRLSNAIADVLRYLRTPVLARGDEGLALHQMPELIAQLSADLGVTVKLLIKLNLDERKLHLSRRAIESLLWELLRNAQKFHPQKQPLVEIALAADQPDLLELSVADNGVSLAPEQIAKVWLPYYQAEKHFTGEMPGMGLGLAMVAVLVWGVGGRCRFRNRDNGPGVVVELSLPLRQA